MTILLSLSLSACNQLPAGAASAGGQISNLIGNLPQIEIAVSEQESTEKEMALSAGAFSLEDVPVYSGNPYVEVNGNTSFFTEGNLTENSFESYSDLDELGRCGVAFVK